MHSLERMSWVFGKIMKRETLKKMLGDYRKSLVRARIAEARERLRPLERIVDRRGQREMAKLLQWTKAQPGPARKRAAV
ncbi:MAG: hypothetical protein NDJ72_00820 [Elusimicrobia bacterium]|nr:hypothetical protein [Elusimicrobiota bacterium]